MRGDFEAEVVAEALAGVGEMGCDQRAIMIAPWLSCGWRGLGEDVKNLAAAAG